VYDHKIIKILCIFANIIKYKNKNIMIHDLLENSARFESLNPRFKQAFDFLKTTDLANLPLGILEIDGKNLYANVQEIEGKTSDSARMETHEKYIDIQVPISGIEKMGWIARKNLKQTVDKYNPEKDMALYDDKTTNIIWVQPSEFVVFFPEDGHQPGMGEGKWKKIILKVLI
jgi:YhcH/YjgK/YiaL family protein